MRHLQRVMSPLLPGAPVSVINSRLPILRAEERTGQAEAQAVLESLGREALHWGASIAFSRALRAADQLVPGLAFPYTAYALFSSLSAASQGHLSRAMQTLPIASVLPADVLRAFADCLDEYLPDWRLAAPGHEAIILGIAVLALLHGLQREGPPADPATAAGRALLRLFGHLRSVANVLASLRNSSMSAEPDPQAKRRLDGPVSPHAMNASHGFVDPPWSVAFPLANSAMRPSDGNATLAGNAAWLLPSASARGAGAGGPAPKSPVKAASVGAAGKGAANRNKSTFKVSRKVTAGNPHASGADRSPGEGRPAMRGAADMVGLKSQGQKESTAVARPHDAGLPHDVRAKSHRAASGKEGPVQPDRSPSPQDGCQPANAGGIGADDPRACGGHSVDTVPAIQPEIRSHHIPIRLSPACLRFRDPAEAMIQVKKNRFDAMDVRFCVRENDTALFEEVFVPQAPGYADRIHWMHSLAVHQDLPGASRDIDMLKYSGLGQLHRYAPRRPLPVGSDEIYSVLSMSVLPERQLRRRHIDASQWMERNGFKLLELTELGGRKRIFIAYFLNRATDTCRGAKAGFLEIHADSAGSFRVTDEQAGYVFSSDSLPDLVAGIEKFSGCRFQPGPEPSRGRGFDRSMGVPISRAQKLFINEKTTWCGMSDHDVQMVNDDLLFFPMRKIHVKEHGLTVLLYPKSFSLLTRRVIYHDADGRIGTLALSPAEDGQDRYLLQGQEGAPARFAQHVGLREEVPYTLLELIDHLESHGLTWIPIHDADGQLLRPRSGRPVPSGASPVASS